MIKLIARIGAILYLISLIITIFIGLVGVMHAFEANGSAIHFFLVILVLYFRVVTLLIHWYNNEL